MIDFLLTSSCLSHGNNSSSVLAAQRVGNDHDARDQQTQCDEPFLSIVETVIRKCHTWPGEDLLSIRKVKTVLHEVGAVLCLVPLVNQFLV